MSGEPATVVIGTTNHCNAKCTFCFRERLSRPQGTMSQATFERIIEEFPAKHYDLCLFGDPLMDKQIADRVEYIKARYPDAVVYFHTNGGLLTREKIDALREAGLSCIFISCYGSTAEQHDRLQPPTCWSHIVEMVEYTSGKLPVAIISNGVETMDVDTLVRFWRARGCAVVYGNGFTWGDGSQVVGSKPAPGKQCLLVCNYRVFDWDGAMATCCLDFNGINNFGNVNTDRWQTALYRLRDSECRFCVSCMWQSEFDAWRKAV